MDADPYQRPLLSVERFAEAVAGAESLEDLAELLRTLRRRHARERRDSSLTYQELAEKTGWSRSAIAEYFTARTLPPIDRFDALLEVLGVAPAERRALASARDRVEENRRREQHAAAQTDSIGRANRNDSRAGASRPTRGPWQLPADTGLFTGRAGEVRTILDLAEHAVAPGPGAVVISAIDGMGGVGKTALAVHAGHLLADRFPDGALFLELHTHTVGTPARTAFDVQGTALVALGVAPEAIPADPDARAAAYRDRLAGTRTLVLVDDARDEAQVRALLPGTAGCLVLATSRNRLKALDDAEAVPLDVLAHGEAVELFAEPPASAARARTIRRCRGSSG
ncbi:helix-turn-helix domain-containing protein [Catenulispora yoronensis]